MIESFKVVEEVIEKVDSKEMKLSKLEMLDQPLQTNDVKDREKTYGSLDQSLENISDGERRIYEQANLEPQEVNERECLTRTDIDPDAVDGRGRTNLERMQNGNPPLVEGQSIDLHHIGQKNDAPLAELTQQEHRGPGNSLILHDKIGESEINRYEFKKEREEHWKARAEIILSERGEIE